MDSPDVSRTVFGFDLDDTLYPEADYVTSGRNHVCKQLTKILGVDLRNRAQAAMEAGEADWLGALVREAGLPKSAKESLLWSYRLHAPIIELSPEWRRLLDRLEKAKRPILIVTDGRSVTQRLKLTALGLSHLPALISEDWEGGDKTDSARFREIMRRHPNQDWLYVGDNPAKDFLVPRALGWRTVGLRTGDRGVHLQKGDHLEPGYQPDLWLDDAAALDRWLGES